MCFFFVLFLFFGRCRTQISAQEKEIKTLQDNTACLKDKLHEAEDTLLKTSATFQKMVADGFDVKNSVSLPSRQGKIVFTVTIPSSFTFIQHTELTDE